MAWGGEEERLVEIEAGNRDAKNWQEEAMKILEKAVSLIPFIQLRCIYLFIVGWLSCTTTTQASADGSHCKVYIDDWLTKTITSGQVLSCT